MGEDYRAGDGRDRARVAQDQAQHACVEACQLGILIEAPCTWQEFQQEDPNNSFLGSEHLVELAEKDHIVVKVTIPPAFGLTPYLASHPVVNLSGEKGVPSTRFDIEFRDATPLEYLHRWIDANDVFEDRAELASVIKWRDGQVSFLMRQPQYHGIPATDRQIDEFFTRAGWVQLRSVSGHTLFFHYAFQVLAIDALPRNCYIHDNAIMPFDVILCRPDDDLSEFLRL